MSQAVQSSPSIAELTKALNKFHKVCPKIPKSCKNPFLKSKYADLSTILDIVQPVLNECDLVVQQHPTSDYGLTTIVSHASGEWMSSEYRMQPLESVVEKANVQTGTAATKGITPQSIGSVITYQRRYALGAILALNIDDDNDGNPPEAPPPPKKTAQELMAEAAARVSQPGVGATAPAVTAPATATAPAEIAANLEITQGQRALIGKLFDQAGITAEQQANIIKKRGYSTLRSFKFEEAGELITKLETMIKQQQAAVDQADAAEAAATELPHTLVDTATAATNVGVTELRIDQPATATVEQVQRIKEAIGEWEQAQPGVSGEFVLRLKHAGYQKIAELSYADADELLAAVEAKAIASFFDRQLAGAAA